MSFFRKYINNPYFYTGLLFFIWIAFFDENNLIQQYRLSRQLDDLESREEFYQNEIEKTSEIIKGFETDTAILEKFAREKYHMKKDKEDVFVIVRDGDD
jgi:cell division protein FtsB